MCFLRQVHGLSLWYVLHHCRDRLLRVCVILDAESLLTMTFIWNVDRERENPFVGWSFERDMRWVQRVTRVVVTY